ncbi:nucleotide exchange factor GrpE [Sphaerimonospora thailandensis]|uniref:GrpE protein n=1 Tax=Sphaerimonospora thailandensis TaxID=795644 RepID=A0A8J3R844_9ACTN|nr:nucleotide exchange factor GrpE [Sphaerimonospora thailandensis]GIH70120.1 hypothetical protein Mth01_23730 [Sphaerimonospora thailandensis]
MQRIGPAARHRYGAVPLLMLVTVAALTALTGCTAEQTARPPVIAGPASGTHRRPHHEAAPPEDGSVMDLLPRFEAGGLPLWAIGAAAALVLGVAAAVALALTVSQRGRRHQAGPYPMPAGPYTMPAGVPAPAEPPASRDERAPLVRALAGVAADGASQAVTQQIDRLLSAGSVDRDALVHACVRHRDQLSERFPHLDEQLCAALESVGVLEVRVDGQRFDARVHEAVDLSPTADPGLHDIVARTTRCGYVDGDRVLRVPRVVVYRLEDPRS